MPDPALAVAGLRKDYRHVAAVEHISFELEAGRSLAIVGESGAGKTTVARMIVGLEAPTSGTIRVFGRDRSQPARSARERRRRAREVQIVFQDPYSSLDRRQTVERSLEEIVALHRGGKRDERRARVEELAELVGLDARQLRAYPGALSGGQRQRVAIARGLAAEPDILILDESVSALDVSIQAQILNLLADIRERTNLSYLLISHDLAVVRQLTDEVVVMWRGKVVERGLTPRVLDAPEHEYTCLLRESVPGPGWRPQRRRPPAP